MADLSHPAGQPPMPAHPGVTAQFEHTASPLGRTPGSPAGAGTPPDHAAPPRIGSYSVREALSQSRLRELLTEVKDCVEQVIDVRDRMGGLVEAMLAINSILQLDNTLHTFVRTATDLMDAGYGALEVYGRDGQLDRFIYRGKDGVGREQIGAPPDELDRFGISPENPPPGSYLAVPVRIRDEIFGNLHLAGKSETLTFGEDDEVIVQALVAAAGIAIDNARLFESARARQAWTAAAHEITTEFLAGSPSGEVLAHLTDHARTLSRAEWACLALAPDPDSPATEISELVIAHWSGAEPRLGRALSIEGTTVGTAFLTRVTVALPDVGRSDLGEFFSRAGAAMIMPLSTRETPVGVLMMLRTAGAAPFTAETVELATAFTDQAALAMELAQAQQRMRVLDILTDRDRIAHDLHDHVIQQLFAIGLTLQGTIPRTQVPDVRDRLTDVVDDLQDVVQEIRTSIFELHGGGDRHSTRLRERIDHVIRRESAPADIRTALRINGPLSVVGPDLADQTEIVLREAVRNAARHSGAASIQREQPGYGSNLPRR